MSYLYGYFIMFNPIPQSSAIQLPDIYQAFLDPNLKQQSYLGIHQVVFINLSQQYQNLQQNVRNLQAFCQEDLTVSSNFWPLNLLSACDNYVSEVANLITPLVAPQNPLDLRQMNDLISAHKKKDGAHENAQILLEVFNLSHSKPDSPIITTAKKMVSNLNALFDIHHKYLNLLPHQSNYHGHQHVCHQLLQVGISFHNQNFNLLTQELQRLDDKIDGLPIYRAAASQIPEMPADHDSMSGFLASLPPSPMVGIHEGAGNYQILPQGTLMAIPDDEMYDAPSLDGASSLDEEDLRPSKKQRGLN
jgi:hypothetical protein